MRVASGPLQLLSCLLLLYYGVCVAVSSPPPPQVAQRDFRTKHLARNAGNPLLSSRQVSAEEIRAGAHKRVFVCPTPQPSGGGCCPFPQVLCGTACVDQFSDPNNCGQCGTTCVSGTCNAGACCAAGEPDVCTSGCTNVETDPHNCGFCDEACQPNQVCADYLCQTCSSGSAACDNVCTSLETRADCGACGNACGSDQACEENSGVYSCTTCPSGYQACSDNGCIFLGNTLNCGSCGVVCGDDQICTGSDTYSCSTCSSGTVPCNGYCIPADECG